MRLGGPLGALPMSQTMAVTARAAALRAAGRDIASLAAGEPAFDTPAEVVEAMARAARDGVTRYPPVLGQPALRETLARQLAQRTGMGFNSTHIAVTEGGKQALFVAFQALVGPGDEVLVPTPMWVSYPGQLQLVGGRAVPVPMLIDEGRWVLTRETLERAITPRTVGLVLNSPHNPTGWIVSAAEAADIAEVAERHDLWVLCDDVYVGLELDGGPIRTLAGLAPGLAERLVIVDSASKRYAMTGWRIGCLAGPEALIRQAGTWLSQVNSGTAPFVQQGYLAALEAFGDTMPDGWRAHYLRNLDTLGAGLDGAGWHVVRPEGAFYVLARPPGYVVDDVALAADLLEHAGVAAVPGAAFAAPGRLRLSFAAAHTTIADATARLVTYTATRLLEQVGNPPP
jgi:aspartate aminotransferase